MFESIGNGNHDLLSDLLRASFKRPEASSHGFTIGHSRHIGGEVQRRLS